MADETPVEEECPNDCARFDGQVPGHEYGSNWPWVPCQHSWHAEHPIVAPTADEQLAATLRAECVEFHADNGITHDCAYVRSADRITELLAERDALAARAAELEARLITYEVGEPCSCGWGGVHDPDNPRCAQNEAIVAGDGRARRACTTRGRPVSRLSAAMFGTPIVANDTLPLDQVYRCEGRLFMSRLTLGRMRTQFDAPDGVRPVIPLSFREWRRWKLRR